MPAAPHEPITQFAAQMEGVRTFALAGGQVAVFSQRSPDKADDKNSSNEDALALLPVSSECGVLAIADGCGGQFNGREAAERAITALVDSVMSASAPELIRVAILDGFEAATRRVAELGNGAATTLIAVEVQGKMIRTYHVGDSQAMLVGSRGKVKLQTRAHSPVGYAVEAGMLTEDAALEHEDRHLVSNVIGSSEAHIDVGMPRPLGKRDTLVIGSDGLYDNLTQAEIVELVRKGPLPNAAESTRQAVAQRMAGMLESPLCKPDDFTLIMFRLNSERRPPPPVESTTATA